MSSADLVQRSGRGQAFCRPAGPGAVGLARRTRPGQPPGSVTIDKYHLSMVSNYTSRVCGAGACGLCRTALARAVAPAWDRGGDPDQEGSAMSAGLRPRGLSGAQPDRAVDQPPEAVPPHRLRPPRAANSRRKYRAVRHDAAPPAVGVAEHGQCGDRLALGVDGRWLGLSLGLVRDEAQRSRSSERSPVSWFWRMAHSSWLGAAL